MTYENGNNHDGGLTAILPISITPLNPTNQDLTVLGSSFNSNNDTSFFPSYDVVGTSVLTTYPLTVGTSSQFPAPIKFTDQGGGSSPTSGSFSAAPSSAVHTLAEAKSWFTTPDAKTSFQTLKSFSYNK
ncbi:MAG TPA: hypothetical protein VGO07_06155 [Candidatus Saccharimonadales bacterium]|jgi:hypothetical protein|nr:hypothetical protein [Candidatus Saccharimonadales bacterium]